MHPCPYHSLFLFDWPDWKRKHQSSLLSYQQNSGRLPLQATLGQTIQFLATTTTRTRHHPDSVHSRSLCTAGVCWPIRPLHSVPVPHWTSFTQEIFQPRYWYLVVVDNMEQHSSLPLVDWSLSTNVQISPAYRAHVSNIKKHCDGFQCLRSELRPKGSILSHFGINSTPNVVSLSRKYNKLWATAYKYFSIAPYVGLTCH